MNQTMKLLEKALEKQSIPDWTRELKLSRDVLAQSKSKGHLSPTVAGAIAESIGLDAITWIAVAAIESARDSACTVRMKRKYSRITSLYYHVVSKQRLGKAPRSFI
jgi:aromatic ring hydroxylase